MSDMPPSQAIIASPRSLVVSPRYALVGSHHPVRRVELLHELRDQLTRGRIPPWVARCGVGERAWRPRHAAAASQCGDAAGERVVASQQATLEIQDLL